MYPVLFHLGRFAVTSYAVFIGIGLIAGAAVAYLVAPRQGLVPACALDASLVAALGGLAGGRAAYVMAHWAYYSDHLRKALRPWDGGLAWHGALLGGLVALLAYCAIRRIPLLRMLDLLAPGAALLTVCSWLGCFLSGCAHGVETYPGQGLLWALSMELPDLYGIWAPRVAVQLLGAGWGALTLAVVIIVRQRARNRGLVFPLWLALYSAGSFGLGFLRADETLWIAGSRGDQLANLILTLIGICFSLRSWHLDGRN